MSSPNLIIRKYRAASSGTGTEALIDTFSSYIFVHSIKTVYTNLLVHATVMQEMKSDDTTGDAGDVGATTSLQTQVAAILQLLTMKVNEDAKDENASSDWKFVAMVVDRLCFCVFTVSYVVATVVIFRHQLF